MPSENHGNHLSDEGAREALLQIAAPANYLGYVRVVRRVFAVAILSSLFLAVLRLVADFRISVSNGYSTLAVIACAYAASVLVILLFAVAIWAPAVIRAQVLRRKHPETFFFVVKRISGFWIRLAIVVNLRTPAM